MLQGRTSECHGLDQLLERVRDGESSALVIRGEVGIGKTALLDYVARKASGCQLLRVRGVEAEMDFAYAALLQLLAGLVITHAEQLAVPQHNALRRAFGHMDGPAPEAFLVSLAALSLLSQAAEERPVVCLVDDAQWLDRESLLALAFVARRLKAERIMMVFAVREPESEHKLDGLAELRLEGLEAPDARLLLDARVPGGLDEQVRERIIAETRGNPLALLELPRGLTPAELAGGFRLLDVGGLTNRIEESLARRVKALPPETQDLLLIAAAESVGDPRVIAEAAEQLGANIADLLPAQDAGLVERGLRIRFRHPLARSAAYFSATANRRRQVHAALASVTDPQLDFDRCAWHRSLAVAGLDEDVAAELERSASRARARGGVAAAAAFLERAAEMSPDPARFGHRALAAAGLKLGAGDLEQAENLLADAAAEQLEEIDQARIDLLRAQIAFTRTRGSDTPSLLSAAARRLEPLDPDLARETHLEALWAAVRSGRFTKAEGVVEAAEAMALGHGAPARAVDLLLAGVVARLTRGYEPALPMVAQALTAFRGEEFSRENLAWCWLACQLAMDLWDDSACDAIASELGRVARASGNLAILPLALNYSAAHQLFLGEINVAEQLVQEAEAISAATRNIPLADFSVLLAAWRGDRALTEKLRTAAIEAGTAHGEGFAVEVAEWAAAVLHNGLGEYAAGAAAAERAYDPDGLGFSVWVLPELIEAAVRSGDREAAESAFSRLTERSRTSTTEWARGIEAAAHAMLSDDAVAETFHQEAVDQLGRSRVVVLHARAQLNYGEWLRRANRNADASVQLKAAYSAFVAMGARGFAERARNGLLATGGTVEKRMMGSVPELTAREAQIARLASERLTNPEIAAQLYLSPRTVEYHLAKVFTKLGISSRKEIADALTVTRSPNV
ncbi:AAA family ATPase [Streptomyces sp. NPDC002523]